MRCPQMCEGLCVSYSIRWVCALGYSNRSKTEFLCSVYKRRFEKPVESKTKSGLLKVVRLLIKLENTMMGPVRPRIKSPSVLSSRYLYVPIYLYMYYISVSIYICICIYISTYIYIYIYIFPGISLSPYLYLFLYPV